MNISNRFNKILNGLEKVIDKQTLSSSKTQVTEEDYAKWAVAKVNEWLSEGKFMIIEDSRLKMRD